MSELKFSGTRLVGSNAAGGRLEGWPVAGEITQVFGQQSVTGSKHGGLDIGAPEGTPVYAPADGILKQQRWGDFGQWVLIDHPATPWYSAYAHLSRFAAPDGPVEAGALIGYVGSTGVSFGAHLHWAVSTNPGFALSFDQLRDPATFIQEEDVELRERVERLERLIGGNGVDDAEGKRLTGEEALAWMDGLGFSLILGLAQARAAVAKGDG